MPSTWAATADNQLVTFNALRDAYDTNQMYFKSAPTGSNEICTKADIETYVNIDTATSGWSGYSSTRCLTKSVIRGAAYISVVYNASLPSGGSNVVLWKKHYRGATLLSTYGNTIGSTTCGENRAYTDVKYNDTFEVYVEDEFTTTTYQFYVSLTGTCGNGTTTCLLNPTITASRTYYIQPRLSGGAYVTCT